MTAAELLKWRKRCEGDDFGGGYIKPFEVLPLIEELERRMGVPATSYDREPHPTPPTRLIPLTPGEQGCLFSDAPQSGVIPKTAGSETAALDHISNERLLGVLNDDDFDTSLDMNEDH